jgi:hypothetical protein
MSLATRLDRLERALRVDASQCPVCGPVRPPWRQGIPPFTLAWDGDEDGDNVPRLCPRCREPWPFIQLTWGDDSED